MTNRRFEYVRPALMAAQAGTASGDQLLAAGASQRLLDHRVQQGTLLRPRENAYVDPAATPSYLQQLWVARHTLRGWAAVSHEAAAALHSFAAFPAGPLVFLVPHGRHRRVAGATIHQTRDPWIVKVELIDGLLVTTVEYTFVALAAVARRGRLLHALETAAVEQKLTTYSRVGNELIDVARQGKPGVRMLASVLDELVGAGARAPHSVAERALLALPDRFGGPRLVPQWEYPTRQQVNGCADAGLPDALLAVECDSRKWHARIAAAKSDRERDMAAARHGVQVLRPLYEHVISDPEGTWQAIVDT
ncbi:MAG TPA: hypothetical protein VHN98_10045, partial [Acidimicrobiales bacterium]|nr:hypothetical protein [Acidimicrobiales bacterium]